LIGNHCANCDGSEFRAAVREVVEQNLKFVSDECRNDPA
jgi:hypothetical protein